MNYPKPMMKLSELKKLGFPEEFLLRAYRTPGQLFAQKVNPFATNSPIIFETETFEKWRLGELKAQRREKNDRV